MFRNRKKGVQHLPILVVDALGISAQISAADGEGLQIIGDRLARQYHQFQAKVPHRFMWASRSRVWGTKDFEALCLNDMFILHASGGPKEASYRLLVGTCLLYQQLLIESFVPRGGIGFGPLIKEGPFLIGRAFLDAYKMSELRSESTRNICAIAISPSLLSVLPRSEKAHRLICFYKGTFFVHPWWLQDPDLGPFNRDRIIDCLQKGGTNQDKLEATRNFLDNFEDYDAAANAGSLSNQLAAVLSLHKGFGLNES